MEENYVLFIHCWKYTVAAEKGCIVEDSDCASASKHESICAVSSRVEPTILTLDVPMWSLMIAVLLWGLTTGETPLLF